MDVKERQTKQILLMDTLRPMAEKLYEESDIKSSLDILESIYSKGDFRHSYSAFLPFITEVDGAPDRNLDYLAQNLSELNVFTDSAESSVSAYTRESILKLCDHLNLEIARLSTFSSTSNRFLDVDAKFDAVDTKVENFNQNLAVATSEAQNLKTEMLSILSIFSGIIMAFTGSFSLLGSAFANISEVSKYRLFFMTVLLGFVLFNTVFMFLYVVSRIINRPISTRCTLYNRYECKCEVPCSREQFGVFKKLSRKYPYVLYIDVLFISFMLILFVLWLLKDINITQHVLASFVRS